MVCLLLLRDAVLPPHSQGVAGCVCARRAVVCSLLDFLSWDHTVFFPGHHCRLKQQAVSTILFC